MTVRPIMRLTGNPMSEQFEPITDNFECQFIIPQEFDNNWFFAQGFPSQTDPNTVYCTDGNYVFPIAMSTFMLGNCNQVMQFIPFGGQVGIRDVSSGPSPILGFESIPASIGVNDSVYFIGQTSAGQGLYKVSASNDMDVNPNHSKTPVEIMTVDNFDPYSITLLGNNIVYQKQLGGLNYISRYETNIGSENAISMPAPCDSNNCSIHSTMKGDSAFYASVYNYNGVANDAYVFKTTDGLTFSLVATLLGSNSQTFPSFYAAIEFNGYVYYKRQDQNKLMRFKNDGTTGIIELPYVVRHLFKINNRAFVFTAETEPKIYEIDSSNNFILRHTGLSGKDFMRVSLGSSLFYFTVSGTTFDLWKFDLNSSTASLVKAQYSGDPNGTTYCSGVGDNEFVNKLSDSFLFACNNNPNNTVAMKILTKNGVETRIPDIILSTTQNSPFYWPQFYSQNNVAYYRNKGFFYVDSITKGNRLYTIDANDQLSPLFMSNPTLNQQEVPSNAPFLIYKDNLFFIGNDNLDPAVIPANKFEMYKYYESP